jgi:hypothetical protein
MFYPHSSCARDQFVWPDWGFTPPSEIYTAGSNFPGFLSLEGA